MSKASSPARLWIGANTRQGRRAAAPVIALDLAAIALAIAQAFCAATVLSDAIAPAFGHAASAGLRLAPVVPLTGFAMIAVLRALLGVLSERAAFNAGAAARRRLRTDAINRLFAAGPALLRRSHSAELAVTVIDRIEALDGLFRTWIPAATLALAGPALVLLAVLAADPWAALILGVAGLLVPFAMALSGIGAAAASRGQFAAMARLQARFLDRIRGIATIVLAGRAEDEATALGIAADDLRRRTMRVLRVAFLSSAALDCAAAGALVLLALRYAALLRATGPHLAATALFVLLLVPEFFAPLRSFSAAYQDRMQATAAAEALAELPPAPPAPPPLVVRNVTAHGVSIAFDDVTLTWDPARGPALDHLSLRVPAGETVILAGPSGAGKSSIIEILLGFVRPDSGRVTINGADISTLVPAALSRLVGWIGQRPVLFAGTIRDNIRFGSPDATDDDVADAASFARLDAVAATLPQGLDTPVGEGGYGLSGGQAQRVAIARAFLRNAPLLLLDEPTAHLDPATEAELLDSLRRLTLNRTVILASHSAAAHEFGGRRIDLRAGRIAPARGAA
jgi:ATP-binding cassette subfamily C protein CydD